MFVVNHKSSSSATLDLTSRDRYQLQLEISSEDPNINVSLPIGRLARQPGQAQDMPPRCLHMSTLLHSLLVDNSNALHESIHQNKLKTVSANNLKMQVAGASDGRFFGHTQNWENP